MTQHLGLPPRPWAGLETRLYVVADSPCARKARELESARKAGANKSPNADTERRRKLATLSLALNYLVRKRAVADAG